MLRVQNGTPSPISGEPIFQCSKTPAPATPITQDQAKAIADLLSQVPDLIESEIKGDVTPGDRDNLTLWADEPCIHRYLRATKWDVKAAAARLVATMQWRLEYQPDQIDPSEVEPEALTGRSFLSGFDKECRPMLFLVPREERAKDTDVDRQIKFSVFNLERAIKLLPEGVEKLTLVIDYEGVTRANATPLSVSLKYLNIFSNHYPERLGIGCMINPSWYLPVLLTMLGPFMDPVTKSKIHFVNLKDTSKVQGTNKGTGGWVNILDCVDADQLPTRYGGSYEYVYNHGVYWPKVSAL
ncbi:hypothetical protein HDU98_009142 [Podochytrium sp. JEL0797]|nr:hypothetical protein HDU98_009142 [Podochytrium sp. JEL0797]